LAVGATLGAGSFSVMVTVALDGVPSVVPAGLFRLTVNVSLPS